DINEMSENELVKYMSDSRLPVRNKAIEAIVLKGESALVPLTSLLKSDDEELRTSAVFALYRINSTKSLDAVRSSLNDKSSMVRTAAARVVGLARDMGAVDKLMVLME